VTLVEALIVTAHGPVPLQAPDQPVKMSSAEVAVRVTTVPAVKSWEHVLPQAMLPTLLVTVPVPVPVFVTVSVGVAVGSHANVTAPPGGGP
jgi:hypothetical protein